jgi:hypothetical protein
MKIMTILLLFFFSTFHIYTDQVEPTNDGIANASPGDYIIRTNGEKIVLKQADIDYAMEQLGANNIQESNYYPIISDKSSPKTSIFPNIILILTFICTIFLIILIIKKTNYIFVRKGLPYHNKTYIDQKGYRRFRDSDKLVHRYVIEKEIGRKLYPGEVVHHKNRNKLDNSPSNLQVFANQDEHDREHKKSGWY